MLLFNFKIGALKDIMYKFLAFFELNEEITYDLFVIYINYLECN